MRTVLVVMVLAVGCTRLEPLPDSGMEVDSGDSGCSTRTCAGCCDSTGECRLGTEVASCGTAGATCAACGSNQRCIQGACADTGEVPCTFMPDPAFEPVDAGPRCGLLTSSGGSRVRVRVLIEPGGAEIPYGFFDLATNTACHLKDTPQGFVCAALDDFECTPSPGRELYGSEPLPLGPELAINTFVGSDGSRLFDQSFFDVRHATELFVVEQPDGGQSLAPLGVTPYYRRDGSACSEIDLALASNCDPDSRYVVSQRTNTVHRACRGTYLTQVQCAFLPPNQCGERPCMPVAPVLRTMTRVGDVASDFALVSASTVSVGNGRFRFPALDVNCALVPKNSGFLVDTQLAEDCLVESLRDGGAICRPTDAFARVAYLDSACTDRVAVGFLNTHYAVEGRGEDAQYFALTDAGVPMTAIFELTNGSCTDAGTSTARRVGPLANPTFGTFTVELR